MPDKTAVKINLHPKRVTSAVNYTMVGDETYIGITDTSIARAVLLASAAVLPNGFEVIIKDESGVCGTNNITITPAGADVIDGAATLVLNVNYVAASLVCDGVSKWFRIV